jgi:hypothetical protein
MALIDPELGIKLVYVLGITNIIGLLLVLFSCRCMGFPRLTRKLFNYSWYHKFYQKHCYYWWFFVISVLLHTIFAAIVFGWPF